MINVKSYFKWLRGKKVKVSSHKRSVKPKAGTGTGSKAKAVKRLASGSPTFDKKGDLRSYVSGKKRLKITIDSAQFQKFNNGGGNKFTMTDKYNPDKWEDYGNQKKFVNAVWGKLYRQRRKGINNFDVE
jgi:hypothetical protein